MGVLKENRNANRNKNHLTAARDDTFVYQANNKMTKIFVGFIASIRKYGCNNIPGLIP